VEILETMIEYDLRESFTDTHSTLSELGIQDEFFLDLVTTRLVIERIGESDNMGWWDSRVFSETGRARLSEVVPKTSTKARLELALRIGRKAEADRLSSEGVTLFSFGPRTESRISAALEDLEESTNSFDALEELSIDSLEAGWSAPLVDEISGVDIDVSTTEDSASPESGSTVLLADSSYTEDEIESDRRLILESLVREYGSSTDKLSVPFYQLKAEDGAKNP
jgi:hypothetical protein